MKPYRKLCDVVRQFGLNFYQLVSLRKCSLPPAKKLGQGNVFTPVCHCVHRGVSASVHAGIHPLSRHPLPWADTPWADTPGQTPPGQKHPLGRNTPLGRHPPLHSACWDKVNKRSVHILLECNLILLFIYSNFYQKSFVSM